MFINLDSPPLVLSAFPSAPESGMKVIRSDKFLEEFVFDSTRQAWLGRWIEIGWGSSTVSSGNAFAQYANVVTSASAGTNATFRMLPCYFFSTWQAFETGVLQVRRAGVAVIDIAVNNSTAISVSAGNGMTILSASGYINPIVSPTENAALSLFWTGSATGAMTLAQHRLHCRNVLLPGE